MAQDKEGFMDEAPDKKYTDLATVESQRNDLVAEEFPDGPYGSSFKPEVLGKSTPWRINQRGPSPYGYENHELHEGMSRDYPGQDSVRESSGDAETEVTE